MALDAAEPRIVASETLSLYIHWPFCLSKCPYCDFNSHVFAEIPHNLYESALRHELRTEAERLQGRKLSSVFFGGGTPSLMKPETVAALISDARRYFNISSDLEITLEANPTSVEQGRLAGFRDAGVNRVSLGVQSLDDSALTFLGRHHSATEAIKALETARRLFERVSFDLIYARPDQSIDAWTRELTTALTLVSDHLSLYQMTIEPGTRFESDVRQGRFYMPDSETSARLYAATGRVAEAHGLHAYEVSNYARTGSESRHNLTYWRYGDYLGIGPGAHSRLTLPADGTLQKYAIRRHRAPTIWQQRVDTGGHGTAEETALDTRDCAREALLMGLRLKEGIDETQFADRTGQTLMESLDAVIFHAAKEEGYLVHEDGFLRATESGRIRLEALLTRLAA